MFGGRLKNAPSITAKHFLKENIMKFINTCRKYGAKLAVVTAAPLAWLWPHMQMQRCPIRQKTLWKPQKPTVWKSVGL